MESKTENSYKMFMVDYTPGELISKSTYLW